MSHYDLLREFADSWGLLMMVVLLVGVILFTFRPGSARLHKEMALLPLRNEMRPPSASDMKGGLQ